MVLIDQLLHQYRYVTLAVGVGAESMGAPLPGETILIAAAAYAGATHHLSVALSVIVAAAAAIVGDNVGYWLGRRFGPRMLASASRHLGGRDRHLHTVLALFDGHGASVVVGGRFISVARTYAALGAGATGMPWGKFLALNTLGGVGWAALIGCGSAALGAAAGTTFTYALAGAAALTAGCLALVLRLRRRRTGRTSRPARWSSTSEIGRPSRPRTPRRSRQPEHAHQRRLTVEK